MQIIDNYQFWLNQRIQELRTAQSIKKQEDRENGSVWDFLILGCLLEWTSKLNNDLGKGTLQAFVYLFQKRMPKYCDVKYVTPSKYQDLPEQLYLVLRCGLVHGLSLKPDMSEQNSKRYKGHIRENTLLLWHRGNHLKINRQRLNGIEYDRVNIDYESLLEDTQISLNDIFEESKTNTKLRDSILKFIQKNPGIGFSPGTWIG